MASKQIFNPTLVEGVPEITPKAFKNYTGKITLIDVRRPDEFDGELSHIPGAKLITLGPDLDAFLSTHDKDDEIVFVCRSGARSGRATLQSRTMGFSKSVNLQGGMLLWNERKYPVEKQKAGVK
ncbi:MAG: rhodanese-like domain-containing protein [Bdellovibrionota bacterium]